MSKGGHETENLAAAMAKARATWPKVRADEAAFRAWLERAAARSPRALENATDLYLAFACNQGDANGMRALGTLASAEISKAVAHFRQPAGFADDVQQQVMEKLLVGSPGRPARIGDYSGRGSLTSWLRAAGVRTALNLLEGHRSTDTLDAQAPASVRRNDPELAALQRAVRGPLKAAIQEALQNLPLEERNILRFYFVDGLTVEQIAQMRGTHKSTVSRLITRLRRVVRERVESTVRKDIQAGRSELSSMLRMVQSDLDLSIERVLGAKPRSA